MSQSKVLSVVKNLKGRSVLAADTGVRLGFVADVLLHPIRGQVLGIAIRSSDREPLRALSASEFRIGEDAVMAAPGAALLPIKSYPFIEAALAMSEMIGANVVTDTGKIIGRVSDIYVLMDRPMFAYKITESAWQKLTGGGYYVRGDVPRAFSHDGLRLMVPADTRSGRAHEDLADVFSPSGTLTDVHR